MATADTAHTLGEACEVEFEATLEEFQAMLNRKRERTEMLALEILRVEQTWVRSRGGIYAFTTTVLARRSSEDLVRFNRYTISSGYTS